MTSSSARDLLAATLAGAAASACVLLVLEAIRARKRRQLRPQPHHRRPQQPSSDPLGFDADFDRTGMHTVKHELSAVLHGERAGRADALQLWVADMELPCCAAIQRAIAERAAHGSFGYTVQPASAWDAIASWLVNHQGWETHPPRDSFVFSASVVTSLANVLRSLTSVGDGVLVFTPLYAPLQRCITGCGRRLIQYPLLLVSATDRIVAQDSHTNELVG